MTPKPEERIVSIEIVKEALAAQTMEILMLRSEANSLHARIKELEAEIVQKKDA
jgi:hypothetical protein